MPITQIPFQDPVAPPEKQPEQLGLYDARDWETAYSDVEAKVPHLLIQLQDDLARSRKREAVWISIIAHLVLFIVLWNANLIGKYMPWHRATVVAVNPTKDQNVTALTLPPDAQKLAQKPRTNVLSDKDRIAMSRHPELDPKELRKILATPPPGLPGIPGRPTAPSATSPPQQSAQAQQGPQPQHAQQTPRPQFETNQTAQLQAPRDNNSFAKYAAPMSAGSAIQEATEAAAATHGQGGQGGDLGVGTPAHGRAYGNLEITTDTLGVDFFPYLERVRLEVYRHWIEVLPESVFPPIRKKGKLTIEFYILENGSVSGMRVVATSEDTALDRAAWGGITGSNPFPPLPPEFLKAGGHNIGLLYTFFYNYDPKDLP
jgi:TonB family protein